MQAASPGLLIISNYTSSQPGLLITVHDLTLTCDQATDATFLGAQITANSSSTFLAAVTAASALELDAVIDLSGTATASVSKGWPASGLPLGPGTTLTLTSTSPAGAALDLDMNGNLISGLTNNTLRISNLTLVNLCSTVDMVMVPGWRHGTNVTMTSALPILAVQRPYNSGPQSLVIEDSVMYVPKRDMEYLAYWWVRLISTGNRACDLRFVTQTRALPWLSLASSVMPPPYLYPLV